MTPPKTAPVVERAEDVEIPAATAPKPHGPTGFIRVTHPTLAPWKCVVCQSATGPLIDTTKELLALGREGNRVYICSLCVKLAALELGLIEGERMEQLTAAGDLLDEAKHAVEDRDQLIERQQLDLAAGTRKAEALEELLEQERAATRTQRQLFELIEQQARQGLQAAT